MNYRQQIFQLAMSFINIPLDQVDVRIHQALQQTAEYFNVDRSYIIDYDFSAGTVSNTHEWCAPGISEQISNLQNVPMSLLSESITTHIYGDPIHIPDVSGIPSDQLREFFSAQQIKSLITLPLMKKTSCIGCVGFDAVRYQRNFGSEEIELLTLFAGLLVDLRERSDQERQLRDKERHLRAVIDGTQAGTWEWNIQTGETFFNERWAEMLGFYLSELEPTTIKTWQHLTHPDDLSAAEDLLQKHFTGEIDFYRCEMRMRHKQGHWIWIQDAGRVYEWTTDGLPMLMAGTHLDITEHKRVEQALRESEEMLNASQRLSKVGGWMWNVQTQAMYWAQETYRIHDFKPGEIAPGSAEHIKRSTECYEPEDRPVIQDAFQRCAEEGQPYDLVLPFTTAKGRRLWIRTAADPIHESGKIIRVIGNIMDITDLKKQEQQRFDNLRRQRDILVREVHHRIKNHLQGVLGLMRNSAADHPDLAAMMEPAIRQIRSIANVYGIHSLSGSEAIPLMDLIRSIIDSFPESPKINLSLEVDPSKVTLRTEDAVPTALIINELLTNATKHLHHIDPERPVKVCVKDFSNGLCLEITSGPACLPVNFDFHSISTLGTGLELVNALLPNKGAQLTFEQRGDEVSVVYCFEIGGDP